MREFFGRAIGAMVIFLGPQVFAGDLLAPPSPLHDGIEEKAPSMFVLPEEAAARALQLGFPSVASALYEQLLADPALTAPSRNQFILARVTALFDEGKIPEAEHQLRKFVGPPTPAYRLRSALIAARHRRFDLVKNEQAAFKAEELPEYDRGWYYFLQGEVSEAANDFNRANNHYQQAIDSSFSVIQRARYQLAQEQARLTLGETTEGQLSSLRQTIEKFPGRDVGYRAVSNLAIALNARGDRAGAINVLQSQLQGLSREQKGFFDEWSLLLGMIAGPTEGSGRNALRNLLTSGSDRDKQRVALQLLARASVESPRREEFRAKLDELIAAPKPHPLLEELLLFRAQLALTERGEGQANLTRAEADATEFLERFPGSQLKGLAYGILTDAAWERGQYRNAANLATKAREQIALGESHARLGVLVAEAYFRGGDYVGAADAYRAALKEVPSGVEPGKLIFQEVLSEIRAGRLSEAAKLVDEKARDPRLDATNRWEAEWNLTRSLQADGKVALAYARVNQVLESTSDAATIPSELRARLQWLQARLSFEAGEPKRTLALTGVLLTQLETVNPSLRSDIASTTMLLQVQAHFELNANAASDLTTELLKRLRSEYPSSDAAHYSYIIEADAAARKGRLVDAQALLTTLASQYSKSPYAAYALYQAAGYAEQRGQAANYREANSLIEQLVNSHPDSDLIFYARLRQGHLMRKLNDFPRAQQAYALLDSDPQFADHPGRAAAQLALADTHAAQAENDPTHLEAAYRIYERLLDLSTAPAALRIEAGYKYGLSLARHGKTDSALRIWGLVMNFLLAPNADAKTFGSQGRYWMSRTLIDLADLLRRENKMDQAKEAYDLLVRSGLPGSALASENGSHLQGTPPP